MRRLLLTALASVLGAAALGAQSPGWTDPSPHQLRMVAVAPDVRLEVLDWGGSGPALVFLAGAGNTAHSFDTFAPRFRDHYHVYGITRRGFGASSRPQTGFDAGTRARDVVAVLDSLHVDRAILAGHSFGGDELTKVGVEYPARVRALVYLDAYDYGPATPPPSRDVSPPHAKAAMMTAADSASPAAVRAYMGRVFGVELPEAEIRATDVFTARGTLATDSLTASAARSEQKLMASGENAAYARITVPALAIYSGPWSPEKLFGMYSSFDAANRAQAARFASHLNAWKLPIQNRFRAEVHNAQVVVIPGANHYVFISNPGETERAMRAFFARVP